MNVPCPAVGKWKRQADKGKYHMASHNMYLGRNTLALVKEGNNEGQEVREGDPPGVTQDSENPAEGYRKEN